MDEKRLVTELPVSRWKSRIKYNNGTFAQDVPGFKLQTAVPSTELIYQRPTEPARYGCNRLHATSLSKRRKECYWCSADLKRITQTCERWRLHRLKIKNAGPLGHRRPLHGHLARRLRDANQAPVATESLRPRSDLTLSTGPSTRSS